ncbi:MAG: ATP-binding domain-containing protein [Ignavibacteria bacterium]|nr:ATP-binding domain-containing protein [Ignavibacteria bacterium]
MLEIRKNTFSKSYENSFFRHFSEQLNDLFKERNLDGLLLGSPVCEVDERLQIDALLITNNVVCIIDFKNYNGTITLPHEYDFEVGLWITETGEQVKGGSSKNPFIQLKNQKRRFIEVSKKIIETKICTSDSFNPFHTIRIVCFQDEVNIIGSIPRKESLNFFIVEKRNFRDKVLDIIDVTDRDVHLTEKSFDVFKEVFKADKYTLEKRQKEEINIEVASKSAKFDRSKLYDDQKVALDEIKKFLEDPTKQVFILQGTIHSGKTSLIPFIQELAYDSQIHETEIFAASSRIAHNLLSLNGFEKVNSIYSFIYGGVMNESQKVNSENEELITEIEKEGISAEIPLEIVPLKKCDNTENALFIVDESQLVSDSYHESFDLVFGTGYLLGDFLNFAELDSSMRKIIFIGDPFLLQFGRTEESPLNPAYLEEIYKLNVSSYSLVDKHNYSDLNNQALRCVQNIKANLFNSLNFVAGSQVSIIHNNDKLTSVKQFVLDNIDGHILVFSNEDAHKINLWIKKSIFGTGTEMATNDLVLFHNNISFDDKNDPFAVPKKIYNGQFARVIGIDQNRISETVKIKGEQTEIIFREIALQLNGSGDKVLVMSLENFSKSLKPELSKNETIAFKIILNTQIYNYLKENPFEKSPYYSELVTSDIYQLNQKEIAELKQSLIEGQKVKGKLDYKESEQKKLINRAKSEYRRKIKYSLAKDPSTKYYKYKNAALLRFGWAMTIHKSVSFKWDEVIINIESGIGYNNSRNHETYFRMLYTALSRARQKVNLINYKSISPFDNTEIIDSNTGMKPKEVFFQSYNSEPTLRIEELKAFVTAKLAVVKLNIKNIEHYDWQERYIITNENNQATLLSISYTAKGLFHLQPVLGGDGNLSKIVLDALTKKSEMTSFDLIKDEWRKLEYEKLRIALFAAEIKFEAIVQFAYKDKIRFYSHASELEIEVDYGNDGMVRKITAKYYSDQNIWNLFKESIIKLKQE